MKKQNQTAQDSSAEGEPEQKPKTTRQQLRAINGVHCLYRHEGTGEYYGIKKHLGKIKTKCLEVNDRRLAEAKLDEWIKQVQGTTGGLIALHDLVCKWYEINLKKYPKTKVGYKMVKDRMIEYWKHNPQTHTVKVSEILDFIGNMKGIYEPSTFNALIRRVKDVFQMAKNDKNIIKNPFDDIPRRQSHEKVITKRRLIPTEAELKQIVNYIRTVRYSPLRMESADMIEFMSYAACGLAECFNLRFEDIDIAKKQILVRRQKTQKDFYIPFYPWLEIWLEKFLAQRGNPKAGQVFKPRCIQMTMRHTCQMLKFPNFGPRDVRKLGIERALKAGCSIELVAEAQGHRDSSLLQKVYRYVYSKDTASYRDSVIAKMTNPLAQKSD